MGLIEMLTKNIDYFHSKPVNIPKLAILLDRSYQDSTSEAGTTAGLSPEHDKN